MLRKIADLPRPCLNPEHNPPSMIVLEPGVYEHTCPGCGQRMQFVVGGTYMSTTADPPPFHNTIDESAFPNHIEPEYVTPYLDPMYVTTVFG